MKPAFVKLKTVNFNSREEILLDITSGDQIDASFQVDVSENTHFKAWKRNLPIIFSRNALIDKFVKLFK